MGKAFRYFLRRLIRTGALKVVGPTGEATTVGDGSGDPCVVQIADTAAELRLMRDPELAVGELFVDGRLKMLQGDIYDLLEVGMRNLALATAPRWLKLMQATRTALRRLSQRNGGETSRRNVAHHYDLSGNLYSLFLDSDRQYSCAYFEKPDDTLEDAQLAKKRHIAAKLAISADDRVLDIGCGWGGLGLYLAKHCDARVTGVTLSSEQLGVARGRAEELRLSERAAFLFQDYRGVQGSFDRIVSVGMFEHVGVGYYDAYFRKIADLLADDGVALVHTIGRTDGPGATNPWIAKYIFPGGYIPAMSEVLAAVQRADLTVSDVEVLRLHYAETLKAWRERFLARREEALALYDERFARLWEFYLAGSEVGFRLGYHAVFQFQLVKRVDALPITRDYIVEAEARLRARETARPELRLAGE
jgi:cyclopropane-fatty-acyl-phospholipid synthase